MEHLKKSFTKYYWWNTSTLIRSWFSCSFYFQDWLQTDLLSPRRWSIYNNLSVLEVLWRRQNYFSTISFPPDVLIQERIIFRTTLLTPSISELFKSDVLRWASMGPRLILFKYCEKLPSKLQLPGLKRLKPNKINTEERSII